MASTRANCRSSISTSFSCLDMPGIMPSMDFKSPILRIWPSCSSMSLRSNLSCCILRASSSASFMLTCCSAFSISDITSPMPKIRDAIRSGWKTSRSSNFSPVPTNLIGFPVTARTDNAAPPRVSPSNLVSMTPSIPSASLKLEATLTASWPVMASTTSRISWGSTFALMFFSSVISCSSICSRPAVSRIT